MAQNRLRLGRRDAHLVNRNFNDRAIIEGPLAHLSDRELQNDVKEFSKHLPGVEYDEVLRAARVAKNIHTYDEVANNMATETNLPVRLTANERKGLASEKQDLRGQFRHILPVVLTVGCAAFLQGHVQASINCGTVYAGNVLRPKDIADSSWKWKWELGAMNAMPFFAAAIIGTPSALLFNYWIGRRGAITVAALMIFASSLGSAWATSWWQLMCVRIVNGLGMGIKAVSTPILAGEIAFTQWRGSSTLMWQLWVAFGIAVGSLFNLAIAKWNNALGSRSSPDDQRHALAQILGAPFVPAVILLIALCWCTESPRYYMQPNTPHRNLSRAYEILLTARQTQLQALRDLYLIHKSVELDEYQVKSTAHEVELRESTGTKTARDIERGGITAARSRADRFTNPKTGLTYVSNLKSGLYHSFRQYHILFTTKKLQNAVLSTCVVALAQQLCGINVFAFYSNTFFINDPNSNTEQIDYKAAMGLSAGFGAVNFLFGLLAIRRIDTWGRRKLMLTTLPLMSLFLAAAALCFINWDSKYPGARLPALVVFIYVFVAVYSPSLGPIPFTLASESFPLAQREAGCAVAISVNLFFAAVLTLCYPALDHATQHWGGLVIFSALNLVALVLVFLLVEETKGFSLEDLSVVFAVPKAKFVKFQLGYLTYLWRKYARGSSEEEPEFYTVAYMESMNTESSDGDSVFSDEGL